MDIDIFLSVDPFIYGAAFFGAVSNLNYKEIYANVHDYTKLYKYSEKDMENIPSEWIILWCYLFSTNENEAERIGEIIKKSSKELLQKYINEPFDYILDPDNLILAKI